MSLTNPTDVVTEERLKEFYDGIFPYLGGKASAGFTPVGTIVALDSNTPPANYLACDGTVYNIADYPELAEHYKRQYGAANHYGGNGTTTFAVIDLQGEFLRGAGTNSHSGQGSGANVGVHQDATEQPTIFTQSTGELRIFRLSNTDTEGRTNPDSVKRLDSGRDYFKYATGTYTQEANVNTDYKYTTRPTNTSVLFCIATKNIYLDPKNDYSTEEKVVGTWIDGKTLYQRTFVSTGLLSNDWTVRNIIVSSTDGANIQLINYDVSSIDSNGCPRKPFAHYENDAATNFLNILFTQSSDKSIGFRVETNNANTISGGYIITIQYTKTT